MSFLDRKVWELIWQWSVTMLFGDKAGEDNCQHFYSPNDCWHPRCGRKAKQETEERGGEGWVSEERCGGVCADVNIKVRAGECLWKINIRGWYDNICCGLCVKLAVFTGISSHSLKTCLSGGIKNAKSLIDHSWIHFWRFQQWDTGFPGSLEK